MLVYRNHKKKYLASVLAFCFAMSLAMIFISCIFFVGKISKAWIISGIVGVVGNTLLTVFFGYCVWAYRKMYQPKYLITGRNYKKQTEKILPHFESFSPEMKENLKKDCRNTYRIFGTVLKCSEEEGNEYAFTNAAVKDQLLAMTETLLESVENGKGWNYFIEQVMAERFSVQLIKPVTVRQSIKKVEVSHPIEDESSGVSVVSHEEVTGVHEGPQTILSPRDVYEILMSKMFSYPLLFLFDIVYSKTEFYLADTGVSIAHTLEIAKLKKELDNEYTPALASFKEELLAVRDLLKNGSLALVFQG